MDGMQLVFKKTLERSRSFSTYAYTEKNKLKKSGARMMTLIVFLADLYVPLTSGDGSKPNQLFDALTYTLQMYFAFFSLCLGSNVYFMTPEHHFETNPF